MQPDDRPVMWSELRRIVDTMSAVQPVEPAEPTGPKESWKPSSENDWLLLFCARCGQRDEVRHARHFVPPPCSAECEPGARMFPKGVLPYITPPSPIDAEALADTVWEALNEWKHSPRKDGRWQIDVTRDARIDRAEALRAKLDHDLAERLLRRVIVYLSGALRDAGCAESRAAVHDLARLVLHEAAALPSLPQSAGDSATHAADSHGD